MINRGAISVRMGMLPEMKTTDPYSPSARAKARANPVMTAGNTVGQITVKDYTAASGQRVMVGQAEPKSEYQCRKLLEEEHDWGMKESVDKAGAIERKPAKYTHPNREHRAGVPAIDATEVRVTLRKPVGRVKPWTHLRGGTLALSDCTVTRADGTTYTIPANARKQRDPAPSKPRVSKHDTASYWSRVTKYGAVGNTPDA